MQCYIGSSKLHRRSLAALAYESKTCDETLSVGVSGHSQISLRKFAPLTKISCHTVYLVKGFMNLNCVNFFLYFSCQGV